YEQDSRQAHKHDHLHRKAQHIRWISQSIIIKLCHHSGNSLETIIRILKMTCVRHIRTFIFMKCQGVSTAIYNNKRKQPALEIDGTKLKKCFVALMICLAIL